MSEREHVTQYFHNNPDQVKITKLKNRIDDSKYRITVDEEADLVAVKLIFEALYSDKHSPFGVEEIKEFLDKNPKIWQINSMIVRNEGLIKSLKEDSVVKQ